MTRNEKLVIALAFVVVAAWSVNALRRIEALERQVERLKKQMEGRK